LPKHVRGEEKAKKIPEGEIVENLKSTVKQGFTWLVEVYDELADEESSSVQTVLLDIMKNVKKPDGSSVSSNDKELVA
jgi:hypothetical protein